MVIAPPPSVKITVPELYIVWLFEIPPIPPPPAVPPDITIDPLEIPTLAPPAPWKVIDLPSIVPLVLWVVFPVAKKLRGPAPREIVDPLADRERKPVTDRDEVAGAEMTT
jgi:hypothetical protein